MEKEKIKFIFNPFNVDIQYCLNNNISYIDVIIIKYINYCLSNYKMIKIKNINEKGEEIEYVWNYYKAFIIFGLVVLILLGMFISDKLKDSKKEMLYGIILGNELELDKADALCFIDVYLLAGHG